MSPNDKSSKSSSSSVCIWVQPRPLPEMVPHLSGDQRLQLHRGTYWKEFSKCCNYIEPLPWCSENTWPNPTITLRHWKVFSKYWIMRTRCMTVEQTHLNFYRYIICCYLERCIRYHAMRTLTCRPARFAFYMFRSDIRRSVMYSFQRAGQCLRGGTTATP